MMNEKRWLGLVVVILIGAMFFVSGFYFGKGKKVIINPLENVDFRIFNEVYYLIEKIHPEFDNLTEEDIVYGAVEGMLKNLGDDHTTFLTPQRSKIFIEDVSGEFQGVGIEIGVREKKLQVISPLKNTPAYKAGIKSGDIITAVDNVSTENMTIEEAVIMIRGEKGMEVVLEIERDGNKKEISIVRDVIKMPSMELTLIEGNIAHIKLFSFHENAMTNFVKNAKEISEGPAEKIILDLRNNPGGILDIAINIASYFLNTGETVLLTGKTKDENNTIIKKKIGVTPLFLDYPVVVIINKGSASASEILAGALKDQREAVIVGEKSFGKGSIQSMQTLIDGSVLKITERYFFTPNGEIINNEGISPDVVIEMTEEDIEKWRDPQLEEAVKIINNM